MISDALTIPGPFFFRYIVFGFSEWSLSLKAFIFNIISVTSSFTPVIDVNSCRTPSMRMEVTAAPTIDESSILLNEFPIVVPNPLSKGSAKNFP